MKTLLKTISLILAFSLLFCTLVSCDLLPLLDGIFEKEKTGEDDDKVAESNSFKITFIYGDGRVDVVYSENNTARSPAAPSKDGYRFKGWYLEDGSDGVLANMLFSVTSDLTLYAKWESTVIDIPTPGPQIADFVMPESGYDGSAVTITFYHQMGSKLKAILDTAIADFNKIYPNITIEHESLGDYNTLYNQIQNDIRDGKQPNIAYSYSDHVALYNSVGAVQPLNVFMEDENVGYTQAQLDDFVQAYLHEGKAFGDGKTYCLPISKSTEVLYYNKTFFDQYGLKVPTTWDEMEDVCKQIKEIDPTCIPLGYDSESNWFVTMCAQYGSPYTSATGDNFLFNNQTNIDFVTRFRTWYKNGWVTTAELAGGYTSALFTCDGGNIDIEGNRCYMCIASTAGATYQQPKQINGVYEFEVGITSIPQVNPAEPKVISQGPSICLFKQENPQEMVAAWLFAKFLTTDHTFQGSLSMSNGYAPVIKSVKNNTAYANFLAKADENGTANITAYAVKVALYQIDAYFSTATFVGSSSAYEQVGLLLQKCFQLPEAGLEAAIKKAFEDAFAECKRQIGQ